MLPGQVEVGSLNKGDWFSLQPADIYSLFLVNHNTGTTIWAIQFPNRKSPLPRKTNLPWIATFASKCPVYKRNVFNFSFDMEITPWQME